jgi:hypothetical protein
VTRIQSAKGLGGRPEQRSGAGSATATGMGAPPLQRCTFIVRWPALARIVLPPARPAAEAELTLTITLEGELGALRGTAVVVARRSSDGELGTSSDRPLARTLLERPIRGSMTTVGAYRVLDLRADGGPSIEALVADASDLPRPAYLRTDLMLLLGLDGGRYGPPTVELNRASAADDGRA